MKVYVAVWKSEECELPEFAVFGSRRDADQQRAEWIEEREVRDQGGVRISIYEDVVAAYLSEIERQIHERDSLAALGAISDLRSYCASRTEQ